MITLVLNRSMGTFLRSLQAIDFGTICVVFVKGLLADVFIEGSCQVVGNRQLQIIETLTILCSKLSLSKYYTHVEALNIVHDLSAEQLWDARPPLFDMLDSPFQGIKEQTAELLCILLNLHFLF